MSLIVIILLSIFLVASIVINVMLYKAGTRQLDDNEILIEQVNLLEDWISDFKADVQKTFADIKMIDDKQMFEKDDDVGIVFRDMMELIRKLIERTENIQEPEEGE